MGNEQFSVIIQAILEKSGITKELSEIQKIVDKNMVTIIPKLETASLKNNLKQLSAEIAKSLNQSIGGDFKITGGDVFKALNASLKETAIYSSASQKAIDSLANSVLIFKTNNSKMANETKKELTSMYQTLVSGANLSTKEVDELRNRFNKLKLEVRSAGKMGKSFSDSIKEGIGSFSSWLPATGLVMSGVNTIKKLYKAVYDIDTAMTNLYKVTDETDTKYNKFLNSASDNALELGRSVSSLVEQTANWAKLGFNIDEAESLAKISSIYSNVGEVSDATAVSDLVTAMKSFNIEASDAITIVDKLNTLGNKYATSAADLGQGLSRSASAMVTAGTNIDKTLAMLTGGAEITQSADEFGNMLKVASMRIRGMKGELESLGEEVDDSITSISKVQTQILNLTQGKVNIFDANGEFRDYYDIMEDIAKIYNDLSSTSKASLLEILFGKQRGNQGAALLQAFQSGQIQKAYADIQNSAGSAMQEQERWMESLEAKTSQFEVAFQLLYNTVLDSDIPKFFVDLGTKGISALDALIDKFGVLGTAGVIGGGILGTKNAGRVKCYPSYHICL